MRINSMAAAAALLLGGCATNTGVKPPPPAPSIPAPNYNLSGLERVMGQSAASLQALFGRPDLDVHEAASRKLQFASSICVLDAYLYPPRAGAEPLVKYIDTRQPDGRDIDRASCVSALVRRQGGK